MINFDVNKLTFEYAYIDSIGQSTISIIAGEDHKPYENTRGLKGSIIKGKFYLSVHSSVARALFGALNLKKFSPRKVCIFYYEKEVLFVDVDFMAYEFVDGKFIHQYINRLGSEDKSKYKFSEWKSRSIDLFDRIQVFLEVESHRKILFDGNSLILRSDDPEDRSSFLGEKEVFIEEVRYIDIFGLLYSWQKTLSNIFISANLPKDKELSAREEEEENKQKSLRDIQNSMRTGFVISFFYDGVDRGCSPVIQFSGIDSLCKREYMFHSVYQKAIFDRMRLRSIKGIQDKHIDYSGTEVRANLQAIITVAKVVVRHYDYDAVDYLDIPQILRDFKTINIVSEFDFYERTKKVVGNDFLGVFSYICGYIVRENKLTVLRDLVRAFNSFMSYGVIVTKEVDQVKEAVQMEIPERRSIDQILLEYDKKLRIQQIKKMNRLKPSEIDDEEDQLSIKQSQLIAGATFFSVALFFYG